MKKDTSHHSDLASDILTAFGWLAAIVVGLFMARIGWDWLTYWRGLI